jgi:hypothetical protein
VDGVAVQAVAGADEVAGASDGLAVSGKVYPCLDTTSGRPFGYYVHGGNDVTGAVRGIESITTGLGWRRAAEAVTVTGEPGKADVEACWELGATVAAGLTS